MELKVVKHIKEFGLEATLSAFKLKARDYPHKVLIKYDQIESDMSLTEVQECRGLVLEKGTWKVMSMSFYKFFNAAEGHAAKINWNTAHILEKLDGSMIQVYKDWVIDKWCIGTTGTAEAEGEVNNKFGTTFADLFHETAPKNFYHRLRPGYTYVFELCTPYNIVVKPHSTSSINLLAIRDLSTLKELSYSDIKNTAEILNIPIVKAYNINATNTGHLIKTFDNMPYTDEGYVVVDDKHNRIKIKNPAYVAVHHLKSKTAEHNIMEIVKTNEIEEFGAVFPERKKDIIALKKAYDDLNSLLNITWSELKQYLPKNITKEESKKYAMKVFEISKKYNVSNYSGLFFSLKDNKVKSVESYLINMDNKKLYNSLEVK